jgi:hypothetical protein
VVGARHADAQVLRVCQAYQDAAPWPQAGTSGPLVTAPSD